MKLPIAGQQDSGAQRDEENMPLDPLRVKSQKLELMAPAGSFSAMQAAIDNGADSVYFGVEQLSMRARATMNFELDDLPEIHERCAAKNVRTYLTLNTIMYDHDRSLYRRIVDAAKEAGITAIIAADQGVISYARRVGMPIHISTQLSITNVDMIEFYAPFADTMVLSRELTLSQVKTITRAIEAEDIRGPSGERVRIEVFAHGALCMAISGKCHLSLHSNNASASRGACVQNCRRSYLVIDKETGNELEIDNEYIMSAKDLCTIGFLDRIADAGVGVLKIEGRGKAAEYVATTTACYREAIDALAAGTFDQQQVKSWMTRLSRVFNRGFWDGYYLGQKMGEWTNSGGSSATVAKNYVGKGVHYYGKIGVAEFKVEAGQLAAGDTVLISGPTTGVIEMTLEELRISDCDSRSKAKKGDIVTFSVPEKVRASDRLYRLSPIVPAG